MRRNNAKSHRGRQSYLAGIAAEFCAALLLLCKGYHLLGWRKRTLFGEVDLLFGDGNCLVLVEVKIRSNIENAAAAIALDQQKRLMAAGNVLLARAGKRFANTRCDAVICVPWHWPRHIKNAF